MSQAVRDAVFLLKLLFVTQNQEPRFVFASEGGINWTKTSQLYHSLIFSSYVHVVLVLYTSVRAEETELLEGNNRV